MKRYLITSALPYANSAAFGAFWRVPICLLDIYVRYLRAMGREVYGYAAATNMVLPSIRAKKEGISLINH
ncbi:MAG: class I tRNA ligase family protein [Saprospiraceae bacterium]